MKKTPDYPRIVGQSQRYKIPVMIIPEGDRERNKRNIWSNGDRFSQMNVRHQTIDPGRSENIKRDK